MGGVASDITEKKLLEERLKLKDYALDNSPVAVGIADFKGHILYINNAFIQLFKYPGKEEVIGKHITEFASTHDRPNAVISALKEGKIYVGEGKPKRKNGETFDSIITASDVVNNNKPICYMALFVDITERKKMESKLKEHEARLQKMNNEKDKFFSIIAHDLKSPFNGMLGLLNILADDYKDFSDKERLKIIQSSQVSAQKAFSLLSDLLEWARLQNEQYEIQKELVVLGDVINENINLYQSEALEKKISIKNNISKNIQIQVDINSLNAVVRNLLINALKFTYPGGSIVFNVKKAKSGVELSIKDTGTGMSAEIMGKLFRLDENITMPGTNNEKGTGLGLIICNDLIIKNKWKMDIDSQPGKGTTIKILIPAD